MEGPARVTSEPSANSGILVAAVVVEAQVDQPAGRDVAFEAVQETLVPVAPHALPDHRAIENIDGGKTWRSCRAEYNRVSSSQRAHGRGLGPDSSRRPSAPGCAPAGRRTFCIKLWVAAEFENPQPVRGETMGVPDLLHGAVRQPHRRVHRPARPVGG
jgi:hypothetical protein